MLQRLIVTGGAGFIGRHVCDRLIEMGVEVVVIDHSTPATPEVEYLQGAIELEETWQRVSRPSEIDGIIHLAARTSVLRSIEVPHETFVSNVIGTHQVLEFARQHGIRSVAMASTNAVVGNTDQESITDSTPLSPLTPYGATKAAGEMLGSAYHHAYGISTAMVRLTNVYGPKMWKKDSIVPRLLRRAAGVGDFAIYGDGNQFRDFVYVTDVAQAFISLIEDRVTTVASFGSGSSISVNHLVELVQEITGTHFDTPHAPPMAGEMRGVSVSLANAAELGLKSTVDLRDGLRRTWADFLEHLQSSPPSA